MMLTLPLKEGIYNQAPSKTQGCGRVVQCSLSCTKRHWYRLNAVLTVAWQRRCKYLHEGNHTRDF